MRMSRSFSSLSVRARLVTMKYGTVSAAPLATLATVALTPTAWSFGRDHRVRAGAVGHAQAGAEVVRVGDAVEHQQQRVALDRVERVVERMAHRHRLDARHHALVAVRAAQLVQALVVAVDDLRAGLAGALDELRACAGRAAWRRRGPR